MSNIKKIAILINGGDAPGLNAVIRAIEMESQLHQVYYKKEEQ